MSSETHPWAVFFQGDVFGLLIAGHIQIGPIGHKVAIQRSGDINLTIVGARVDAVAVIDSVFHNAIILTVEIYDISDRITKNGNIHGLSPTAGIIRGQELLRAYRDQIIQYKSTAAARCRTQGQSILIAHGSFMHENLAVRTFFNQEYFNVTLPHFPGGNIQTIG